MKVWIFYLTDRDIIDFYTTTCRVESTQYKQVDLNSGYLLYAYTDKKKLARLFRETRNMEKFYVKEIEITEEEFKEMDDIYHGFNNILLSSLSRDTDQENTLKIPLTSTEQWICVDNAQESLFNYVSIELMFDWTILSDKMKEHLWKTGFMFFDDSGEHEAEIEELELKYGEVTNVRVKEPFGLFITLYDHILDKDGLLEVVRNG